MRKIAGTFFFQPHTVWSSLARTNSDGFLAPCFIKRREERTRKKEKFYIYLDVTHTHSFTLTLLHICVFTHTHFYLHTHTHVYTQRHFTHTHARWHFYTNAILHTDRFYKHTHTLAQKYLIELLMWNASYVQNCQERLDDPTWELVRSKLSTSLLEG